MKTGFAFGIAFLLPILAVLAKTPDPKDLPVGGPRPGQVSGDEGGWQVAWSEGTCPKSEKNCWRDSDCVQEKRLAVHYCNSRNRKYADEGKKRRWAEHCTFCSKTGLVADGTDFFGLTKPEERRGTCEVPSWPGGPNAKASAKKVAWGRGMRVRAVRRWVAEMVGLV